MVNILYLDINSIGNDKGIDQILMNELHIKDKITSEHCKRVQDVSMKMGQVLNLDVNDIGVLIKSALFHDIGKIVIDDNIIKKPRKLSKKEWNEVKKHPIYGELIFTHYISDHETQEIGKIIRHHHEHYNGNGYPDGLSGEDIPLLSRIISIADVFDALTSKRPYRNAFSLDDAICIMNEMLGRQLDPTLTRLFIKEVLKY